MQKFSFMRSNKRRLQLRRQYSRWLFTGSMGFNSYSVIATSCDSPSLTQSVFDDFQETSIGVVKWITAASADGKLTVESPVVAEKQFFALLDAFTVWPYLYGKEYISGGAELLTVQKSDVDMFLNNYEARRD